jgi:hypothetical protein
MSRVHPSDTSAMCECETESTSHYKKGVGSTSRCFYPLHVDVTDLRNRNTSTQQKCESVNTYTVVDRNTNMFDKWTYEWWWMGAHGMYRMYAAQWFTQEHVRTASLCYRNRNAQGVTATSGHLAFDPLYPSSPSPGGARASSGANCTGYHSYFHYIVYYSIS